MRICKVVFNINDSFVEELRQYAPSPRLIGIFKRNENRPKNLSETFYNLKPYTYKTTIEDLIPGDRVVVQTGESYTLATFISYVPTIEETPKGVQLKLVVAKVDFQEFENMKFREDRKKELLAEMVARKKKIEEEMTWTILAEKDPMMKAMLEEMNNLDK